MPEKTHAKQTMPALGSRGLTQDYYNYVNNLRIVGDWMGGGIRAVNEYLRDHPLPLYTEAYPERIYENVVNSRNKEDVARLEEIIRELNDLGKAGTLSVERWKVLDAGVSEILYGNAGNDPGTTTR